MVDIVPALHEKYRDKKSKFMRALTTDAATNLPSLQYFPFLFFLLIVLLRSQGICSSFYIFLPFLTARF